MQENNNFEYKDDAQQVPAEETAPQEPIINVSEPSLSQPQEENAVETEPEKEILPNVENIYEDEDQVEEPSEVESPEQSFIPAYNPINYTVVEPVEDRKPMSRGMRFFAFLMALVVVATAACAVGYYYGGKKVEKSYIGNDVAIGLEAKPVDTDEMTAAQVYEKVNPSVVGICIYNSKGQMANASGVFYTNDGYIVTNDHIYSDIAAPKFKIYTHDNKEYEAVYVAGDKVSDLAVLKIKDGEFTSASFGNSDQLIFGENVVAIGRPGGASNASSITKGIISAKSCRVQTTSSYSSRLIETDSPINPGSSGGALVNMYGQVIGITSSKLASADIDAVGYAIPTTTMKRIVEELIKHGKVVTRAKLGITYMAIDSVSAEIKNYSHVGLHVESVAEDSDLYQKVKKGDIITHINGIEVTSDEIVLDIIERSRAGDKIDVTYIDKDGESVTIEAELKANVGESSYTTKQSNEKGELPQLPESGDGDKGGAFDFPFGE